MVDTEGSIEEANLQTHGHRGEDRKVDLIVNELKRYNVTTAVLQETKWFGSEIYQVNRNVVIWMHSACSRRKQHPRWRSSSSTHGSSNWCMEERWQALEGMKSPSYLNMLTDSCRHKRQTACHILLCTCEKRGERSLLPGAREHPIINSNRRKLCSTSRF